MRKHEDTEDAAQGLQLFLHQDGRYPTMPMRVSSTAHNNAAGHPMTAPCTHFPGGHRGRPALLVLLPKGGPARSQQGQVVRRDAGNAHGQCNAPDPVASNCQGGQPLHPPRNHFLKPPHSVLSVLGGNTWCSGLAWGSFAGRSLLPGCNGDIKIACISPMVVGGGWS